MATRKDRSGPDHHFPAVLAVLALALGAGLIAAFTVVTAAQAVDDAALARQKQLLSMHLPSLRRLRDEAAIAAAGRAIGLDGLARAGRDRAARPAAGLALSPPGGRPAATFVWRPERPGARFLAAARPGFVAAGGLLMLFAFTALWFTRSGMDRIASEKARAEFLAHSDQLTGLANRRVFNQRIGELLAGGAAGEGRELALLAIDLDHFKTLNDRFGHVAGDEALAEVARRLAAAVPATATLTRQGGDEFAVLAPGVGPEAALALAARIAAAIAAPCPMPNGMAARLGASIGIACAPAHGACEDDVIRRADIALYEVKEGGRSSTLLFEPVMEARAAARALGVGSQPSLSTRKRRSTIAP